MEGGTTQVIVFLAIFAHCVSFESPVVIVCLFFPLSRLSYLISSKTNKSLNTLSKKDNRAFYPAYCISRTRRAAKAESKRGTSASQTNALLRQVKNLFQEPQWGDMLGQTGCNAAQAEIETEKNNNNNNKTKTKTGVLATFIKGRTADNEKNSSNGVHSIHDGLHQGLATGSAHARWVRRPCDKPSVQREQIIVTTIEGVGGKSERFAGKGVLRRVMDCWCS